LELTSNIAHLLCKWGDIAQQMGAIEWMRKEDERKTKPQINYWRDVIASTNKSCWLLSVSAESILSSRAPAGSMYAIAVFLPSRLLL
jgi:hypothetical protein